jgi:hypothetical protein
MSFDKHINHQLSVTREEIVFLMTLCHREIDRQKEVKGLLVKLNKPKEKCKDEEIVMELNQKLYNLNYNCLLQKEKGKQWLSADDTELKDLRSAKKNLDAAIKDGKKEMDWKGIKVKTSDASKLINHLKENL